MDVKAIREKIKSPSVVESRGEKFRWKEVLDLQKCISLFLIFSIDFVWCVFQFYIFFFF